MLTHREQKQRTTTNAAHSGQNAEHRDRRACRLLLCALWLLPAHLWSGIQIFPEPAEILLGETEFTGPSINLFIDGPELGQASEESPLYLRFQLPDQVFLKETLVAPGQDPVRLALSVFGPIFPDLRMIAPTESAMIVRWIAGERAIWVRFSVSSDLWVEIPDGEPPTGNSLAFSLGLGLEELESYEMTFPFFQNGWANLPFNTRDVRAAGEDLSRETPTPLVLDLSQFSGEEGELLFLDVDLLRDSEGVETEPKPGDIDEGSEVEDVFIEPVPLAVVLSEPSQEQEPLFIQTTSTVLEKGTACGQAGSVDINFDRIAFFEATPEEPVYLRINLESGALLCETLVDPLNPESHPIHLAVGLDRAPDNAFMTSQPDDMSIVRWKEGESAIWVAIRRPPFDWVHVPEGKPVGRDQVRFFAQLGLSGSDSLARMQPLFQQNRANLPANTNDPEIHTPTDSLLQVDLRESSLSSVLPDLYVQVQGWHLSLGVEDGPNDIIDPGFFLGLTATGPVATVNDNGEEPTRGVLVTSLIQQVDETGRCEETGNYTMEVNDDLFPQASTVTPIYLRLALGSDAVLCDSLVMPGVSEPIHLAMRLRGERLGLRLNAASDALSVVRWVAGERAIWLRVTQSSSNWILGNADEPLAPTPDTPVTWSFGFAGDTSLLQNENDYINGWANLAANTRIPPGIDVPADTRITVDLLEASMDTRRSNWDGLLSTDPLAYFGSVGVETAPSEDDIVRGAQQTMRFFGFPEVAQGLLGAISPEVAVQGIEPVEITARIAQDIDPVSFRWEDMETGALIGLQRTIIWDPIPPRDRIYRLTVRDRRGRSTTVTGILLVNPDGVDLNEDGVNDIRDLHLTLPSWPEEQSVLDMLRIRIE
ncbi:hypothetical protein SCOR_01980 [Sulfidibacter corallicola]|uniref:Uncharacterized protein n=1 Tax=Sulfidibacter corallicola TaxID=2818388 RepID=A0A8A4TF32_SULCO|nr:hypothetical protein [Sulfidibacter corallicola]QTD48709.1 hypothetical protein J3U87_24270 [Sulfidibacter corallicola]